MLGCVYTLEREWFVGVAIPCSEWVMQHLCQQIWTYSEQNKAFGSKFSLATLHDVMASRSYSAQKLQSSLLSVADPHNLGIQAQISCLDWWMYKWHLVNLIWEVLNKGSGLGITRTLPSSQAEWLGRLLGLFTEMEADSSILNQKG